MWVARLLGRTRAAANSCARARAAVARRAESRLLRVAVPALRRGVSTSALRASASGSSSGSRPSAPPQASSAAATTASIPPLSNTQLTVTPPSGPAPEVVAADNSASESTEPEVVQYVIEPIERDGEGDGEGEDGDGEEGEAPWYASGLKFGCTACGKCCTGRGGIVRVNEQEILALSAHLGLTYQQFGRKYLRYDKDEQRFHLRDRPERAATDGACVFLDGKTCSVYPVRPAQCRTFPFWPRFIESKQKWDELGARRCEGINDPNGTVWTPGHVYAQSQIQTLHDSGENYTYDEMLAVLEQLQAAEAEHHNDFLRTALGTQQLPPDADDADADAAPALDPHSDAAIDAAVAADRLATARPLPFSRNRRCHRRYSHPSVRTPLRLRPLRLRDRWKSPPKSRANDHDLLLFAPSASRSRATLSDRCREQ